MKQIVILSRSLSNLEIVLLTCITLSLVLQLAVAVALVFLAKSGEFIDETKRNQLIRNNNWVTIFVLIISIINIFINIFSSV
jgi:hypothetical protein